MRPRFSAANPAAEKVRVLYTSESVIYEGMPVCYDYDATLNIDGYDNTDGAGITTDEGHQNEGKFNRVEDPANNNIMHFAGVVAGSDLHGVTGNGHQWLDIYIPNGAVVPVRCDVDTTAGVTLLAITVDSQEFGQPISGTSRVVALAMETEDALGAGADITLAKLDTGLSLYQNLDGSYLNVGAGTANLALNEIRVESAQTAGTFCALYVRSLVSGGGYANSNAGGGIAAFFRSEVSATPSQHTVGVHINHYQSAGSASGYHFGLWVKASAHADATMTDCMISPLALETLISAEDTVEYQYMIWMKANGTYTPDGLFFAYNNAAIGAYVSVTNPPALATGDLMIPIKVAGITYYLVGLVDDGTA